MERHGVDWFLDFYEKDDKISIYNFEQTPKISCYLYALCAGPYRVWEDDDPMHTPQRIYAR